MPRVLLCLQWLLKVVYYTITWHLEVHSCFKSGISLDHFGGVFFVAFISVNHCALKKIAILTLDCISNGALLPWLTLKMGCLVTFINQRMLIYDGLDRF